MSRVRAGLMQAGCEGKYRLLIASSQFRGLGAELVDIAFAFVMYAVAATGIRRWYKEFLKPA